MIDCPPFCLAITRPRYSKLRRKWSSDHGDDTAARCLALYLRREIRAPHDESGSTVSVSVHSLGSNPPASLGVRSRLYVWLTVHRRSPLFGSPLAATLSAAASWPALAGLPACRSAFSHPRLSRSLLLSLLHSISAFHHHSSSSRLLSDSFPLSLSLSPSRRRLFTPLSVVRLFRAVSVSYASPDRSVILLLQAHPQSWRRSTSTLACSQSSFRRPSITAIFPSWHQSLSGKRTVSNTSQLIPCASRDSTHTTI